MDAETKNWRDRGVKIIPSAQLDLNTAQTSGMTRAAAITHARTGANKLWAGTVTIIRMRKPVRTTMANWKASSISSAATPGCAGGNHWSISPRAAPAILSLCRPSYRIRRSMPARLSLCFASWFEAIKNPSSSIWISLPPRSRNPSSGSI